MLINVVISVQYGGPSFNGPSICRRPDSHTCFFLFFPFVSLEISLFPSIFCSFAVFSLNGEYTVRSFLPNDGVFLPCDHGLDYYWHQLIICQNSDIKNRQYNVGLLLDIIMLTLCDYIGEPFLQQSMVPTKPFD